MLHGRKIAVRLPAYTARKTLRRTFEDNTAMASMIASGEHDVVLASRMIGGGALAGGVPLYDYVANRALTAIQNLMAGQSLSEYRTGYRAWSRQVLVRRPLDRCSDDVVVDDQILAQTMHGRFRIGAISCPTRYCPEPSSIGFKRSVPYGLGVLSTSCAFLAKRAGWETSRLFAAPPARPAPDRVRPERLAA